MARMHFQNRIFRNVEQFAQNRSIAMLFYDFIWFLQRGGLVPQLPPPDIWHQIYNVSLSSLCQLVPPVISQLIFYTELSLLPMKIISICILMFKSCFIWQHPCLLHISTVAMLCWEAYSLPCSAAAHMHRFSYRQQEKTRLV